MQPRDIALIPLLFIICILLIVLSFEQGSELLHNEESAEKCTHTTSRCLNQTAFTIVSISYRKQQLKGKIIQEQGVKLAQFLSVPYADNPIVSNIL